METLDKNLPFPSSRPKLPTFLVRCDIVKVVGVILVQVGVKVKRFVF